MFPGIGHLPLETFNPLLILHTELHHKTLTKIINYYTGLGSKDKRRKIPAMFNRIPFTSGKGKEA